MHKYQERAVKWIIEHERCAAWLDPGLGKTCITLTAIDSLLNRFDARHILVVAPLRVSRSVWPREPQKWEHLSHMTCTQLYWPDAEENKLCYAKFAEEGLGPNEREKPAQRVKRLKRRDQIIYEFYIHWFHRKMATNATFYSINREQVHLLCRVLYLHWPFDTVILDEASSFKHSNSMRFKGVKAIESKIHRLIELTGSPASNGLLNLWSQVFLLDRGRSLLTSERAFKHTYFNESANGYGWEIKEGADLKIHKAIEHLCLTMKAEDYLEVYGTPPIIHRLELPENINKKYAILERDFLLSLDDDTVSATHTAALHNKLRQFCNGAVYVDENPESPEADQPVKKPKRWKAVHDVKLDALKSIYEEAEGQPVLVAYGFRHDLHRILKEFPEARLIDTDQDIDDWNAGKIPMGLGHPASIGHGLNIQFGGHIIVWFGTTWDLELFDQFNKRLDRQGQTHPVIIHILIIDNKTERVMLQSLKENEMTQSKLMNFMKKGDLK